MNQDAIFPALTYPVTMSSVTNSDNSLSQPILEPLHPYWAAIMETENRLRSIEVEWRCTHLHSPLLGIQQSSTLQFLSDYKITRGESLFEEAETPVRHIEVFDGKYNISLSSMGGDEPKSGHLIHNLEERLNSCAPGPVRPLFYFASPLRHVFTPAATRIVDTLDNTVTLECLLPYTAPILGKLVLSKATWRPIRLTTENARNHRLHTTYELTGYQEYEDGIFFPSHIEEVSNNEEGTLLSKFSLDLQKVRFNNNVDTTRLYPPVPKGTRLTDYRFGEHKGVTYRVGNALPSEKYVRLRSALRTLLS